METTGRMYTTKEVAKILSIDYKRIHKDMSKLIIKPTDVKKGAGRGGIVYVFDADTVRKYARSKGIYDPDFSIVGGNEDRMTEDGAIVLTPENFNRIVHGEEKTVNKAQNRSDIIKMFDLTMEEYAYIFNVQEQSARNKFNRNSFTLDDLVALCIAKGVTLSIGGEVVNLNGYFDDEETARLKTPYGKMIKLKKRAELEAQLKKLNEELEEME